MTEIYKVNRRDFLRHTSVAAGSLVLGCSIARPPFEPRPADHFNSRSAIPAGPFVAIEPNGDVIIVAHRTEMGQGIRSSLTAVLADEMEADWSRVTVRQAIADSYSFGIPLPYDIPDQAEQWLIEREAAQLTDGSRSMAAYFMPMRLFGASIRLMMERAAAAQFNVDPAECRARQHRVHHEPSGRSVDYRSLLRLARKAATPAYEEVIAALKPQSRWRYIGSAAMPFVDARAMVTGEASYCGDIRLRGMLTAVIERCPVANGDVKSWDATEALKVQGVVSVTKVSIASDLGPGGVGTAFLPHVGVAVLARTTWAALRGREKLKPTIVWDLSSPVAAANAHYDSAAYRRGLEQSASKPGRVVRHRGNVDAGFERAAKVVEASYYVPHLVQAAMEPPVAIALMDGDHLDVWAPTQNPDAAQRIAGAAAFGIPAGDWDLERTKAWSREHVTLRLPLMGGSFGRKLSPDYIAEAAYLAARHPGTPIRVQWTRDDDFRFGYYNPASHQYLKAGLDVGGRAIALLHRTAFPSILTTFFPPPRRDFTAEKNDRFATRRAEFFNAGVYPFASGVELAHGFADMPFAVPNLRLENCPADNYIRLGCARSMANIFHAFALCSFADELARAAGRDPKDYLLELIGEGSILPLDDEGVEHFFNNGFPVDPVQLPVPGGKAIRVFSGYPPDTRRLKKVVQEVARLSTWDDKKGTLPKGRGLGLAAHRANLTYVAVVFDVSLSDRSELTINEAFCAVDCGLAVNVDRVRAQIEGGINYGLSAALFGEITARNGAVQQNSFDDHPVLRMNQTPRKMTIEIVPSDHDPTGVGEPATPVVAPALANAIVAAGGPRLREIPFARRIIVRQ